ncbi:hypothetical protein SCHPADRAFT_947332 [Schizopora paradoxa]|uniref:Uncharacterized protein n=1 Tax=Schizopora paradoxa TaxID=27342 RepID=A0A0H2QZK5_9AGAM|nr:hypothetical protein SCHPADRAFT_947332 [Schizopora paradoxa]
MGGQLTVVFLSSFLSTLSPSLQHSCSSSSYSPPSLLRRRRLLRVLDVDFRDVSGRRRSSRRCDPFLSESLGRPADVHLSTLSHLLYGRRGGMGGRDVFGDPWIGMSSGGVGADVVDVGVRERERVEGLGDHAARWVVDVAGICVERLSRLLVLTASGREEMDGNNLRAVTRWGGLKAGGSGDENGGDARC